MNVWTACCAGKVTQLSGDEVPSMLWTVARSSTPDAAVVQVRAQTYDVFVCDPTPATHQLGRPCLHMLARMAGQRMAKAWQASACPAKACPANTCSAKAFPVGACLANTCLANAWLANARPANPCPANARLPVVGHSVHS
eukprot:365718-Chlamydomonas_euryale.AAC.31